VKEPYRGLIGTPSRSDSWLHFDQDRFAGRSWASRQGRNVSNSRPIARSGAFLLLSVTLGASAAVEPIPTFYQEPGLSPNREVVDQHVSERIDPFTGKPQIHAVDLVIPGNGGLDIQVQRACLLR
jgi:hypothetical protein